MNGYSLEQLASRVGAKLKGDAACRVFAVNTLQDAQSGDISFLSNPKYRSFLDDTQASAVILSPDLADEFTGNALVMDNPYLGFAKVAQLLDTTPKPAEGIADSAVIHTSAQIGKNVSIGPNCSIAEGVVLADNVTIGPNCSIGKNSHIGSGSTLYSNVAVYHKVSIGSRAIIHAGSVIGSDGFGFANEDGRWVKIPQLGGVVIGDDFECGANCTIDRGAINDTNIGDDVKLDNMCHLAHNVELGDHTAMAAYSGVAGSSKLGAFCTISGRVTILGHIELADGVHVTAGSQVSKSLQPGAYSSGTPLMSNRDWRRNMARLRQLDEMAKTIKQLQSSIERLTKEQNNDR